MPRSGRNLMRLRRSWYHGPGIDPCCWHLRPLLSFTLNTQYSEHSEYYEIAAHPSLVVHTWVDTSYNTAIWIGLIDESRKSQCTRKNSPFLFRMEKNLAFNLNVSSFEYSKTRGWLGCIISNTGGRVWIFIFLFSVGILYIRKKSFLRWRSFLDDRNCTFPEV